MSKFCKTKGEVPVYTLYVCHRDQKPQRISLPKDAPLPCVQRLPLTAGIFFRHARTDIGWTDLGALASLERLYRSSGIPFAVDRAFSGRTPLSPFGSGMAFDIGQTLPLQAKNKLRSFATKSGLFAFVASETAYPDRVHVEYLRSRILRCGDRGVFVCALQRALQQMQLLSDVCSGVYCRNTERAVIRMQRLAGLEPTGIADAWLIHALRKRTEGQRRCHLCCIESWAQDRIESVAETVHHRTEPAAP